MGPRLELPFGGLRVEDLVFVALAAICVLHLPLRRAPRGVSIAVAGVAAAGVVSALVAASRGMVDPLTALLYALRPLEYWIAFPATGVLLHGAIDPWRRRVDVLLAATTVLQSSFAILQYYFGIPIGFSHAAYTRAAGLTVGPYELGAMSALLAVYWVSRGRWVLVSLSVVALGASVSRISLLAAAAALTLLSIIWVVRLVRLIAGSGWRAALQPRRRHTAGIAVQILAVAGAGLVLALTLGALKLPTPAAPVAEAPAPAPAASEPAQAPTAEAPSASPETGAQDDGIDLPSETVTTRIADTSILGSWRASAPVAAAIATPQTSEEYRDIAYGHINDHLVAATALAPGGEASNLVRFFRWHLILDTFDDPVDVVFGLGPSFVGPSVDGSYLRFFADGGLLGLVAWLVLVVAWLRRSPAWMVCITLALLIGAVFIDIVYAERPMVLYWMLLAIALSSLPRRKVSTPAAGAEQSVSTEPAEKSALVHA